MRNAPYPRLPEVFYFDEHGQPCAPRADGGPPRDAIETETIFRDVDGTLIRRSTHGICTRPPEAYEGVTELR